MKKLIVLTFILFTTTAFAQAYTVERVYSGSTIGLSNGENVRLIGIDLLNLEGSIEQGEVLSREEQGALEFVKGLELEGQKVRLESDVQEKDKYGRTLAYVYMLACIDCQIKKDDRYEYKLFADEGKFGAWYIFLNASIIKAGYAQPSPSGINKKYGQLFEELYQEAREQEMGLWGSNDEKIKNQRAIEEALKEQINTRKASGAQMGRMLYKKETKDAARLVYSAINTKFDEKFMGTNKWLEGYTVRKNFGQWMYVGGQSRTYRSEKDLEEMKRWADKILKWK